MPPAKVGDFTQPRTANSEGMVDNPKHERIVKTIEQKLKKPTPLIQQARLIPHGRVQHKLHFQKNTNEKINTTTADPKTPKLMYSASCFADIGDLKTGGRAALSSGLILAH
mmetsp:Transcript_12399/g.15970  ORF Transcript_12399/g.15970 Transcript_12399/m.15970 type:complete len:111 (+) Transcript_12399:314-646(+)